jgi:hypothetical protein
MIHLASALLLSLLLQTQPATAPVRGTIEGVVVRAGTNDPISRALVTITRVATAGPAAAGPPAAPGQRGGNPPAVITPAPVVTGADGKFLIKDLPAGSYRIAAARNGYAKQEFGQRSPRSPGSVINVQAGQNVKDITFRLTPAGTVSGRVTDAAGEPLAGVTVSLLRSAYQPTGKRSFQTAATGRTNDLGEYRLYWITPGRYFLSASTSRGYIESLMQSTIASASAQQRAEDNSGNVTAAQSAGEAMLGINSNEVVEPGFSVTYYPNTIDVTRAAAIDVPSGAELRAMDIGLLRQQTYRVQGRMVDSRTNQTPQTAIVQLANRQDALQLPKPASSYDSASGVFEIREVPPGEYNVIGIVANVTGSTTTVPSIGAATQPVDVSGSDVENIVLTIRAGVTVHGSVALDGGSPLSSVPGFDRIRVRFTPVVEGTMNMAQPPALKPDGTFVVDNVTPGEYRVSVAGLQPTSYIKEGRFGATDVLRDPFVVSAESTGSLELLVSPNAAQITGTLVDKDAKPVPTTQVVLIPERQRDRRDLFKPTLTDSSGRFTFLGVPPGDYRIFSWEDIEPFAYNDPEVLRQHEQRATLVRVSESGRVTQEVKIIPAGQ